MKTTSFEMAFIIRDVYEKMDWYGAGHVPAADGLRGKDGTGT